MANEAVIINLGYGQGDVQRYTVASGAAFEKGSTCYLTDPRTIFQTFDTTRGGGNSLSGAFAGIAAEEKVAAEGNTSLGLWTSGIFDLKLATGATIHAGELVTFSGANTIDKFGSGAGGINFVAALSSGAFLGRALETGTSNEVIAVKLGSFL